MKIVIDIPKQLYLNIKEIPWSSMLSYCSDERLHSIIRNGTPLPKENTLEEWKKDFISFIDELDMPRDDYNGIIEYINEIPTIIEADK